MFCRKCGNAVADGVQFCPKCGNNMGNVMPGMVPEQKVDTWLIPSILATLFCCLPFGIVAIIYAVGANTEVSNRNYALANEKAAKAKMWFWLSFIFGLIGTVLYIIFYGLSIAAAAAGD